MLPKVSITIPCKNEEHYIKKCLDSIIEQTYPKEKLEVFVCDGNSDDDTQPIIKKYASEFPFIKLLINQKETTQFALNLGLNASLSDIAIILGAHAEIDKNYIQNCVNCFTIDKKIGCVGGILTNVYENKTAEIIGSAMSSSFGVGNAHFRTGEKDGYVDTVAFGAYKRDVINTIGGFDEDLIRNQDDEYNYRLLKNDYKIYLSRKIKANYFVRASYQKLFKQYYQYGYWKVFVNKKHSTVTTIRQLVPLFFVLFLISLPFWLYFNIGLIYTGIFIFYLISALFFAKKAAKKPKQRPMVVFTFLILHLSYGIGYLEGIINFILLRKTPKKSSKKLTR